MNDDLPPGYAIVSPPPPAPLPSRLPVQAAPAVPPGYSVVPPSALTLTGQAHDGDTFRLSDGRNARLYGADAFELGQTGRASGGGSVPVGINARDFTHPYLTPGASLGFTGTQTYGRPVTSVTNGGNDLGHDLINSGNAWATPEYLRSDPTRLHDYMEAERLARLNYRGGFATDAQKPSDYRHGVTATVDPWAKPQELHRGQEGGEVVWWDQPTPFQGLRPEIEKGYLAITTNPHSTAEQLLAYAKANGFQVDPKQVAKFYADKAKGVPAGTEMSYRTPPRVLTDLGDGAFGATMRGVADPLNMLDEFGGLGDALLPNAVRAKGQERENIWDSDRRFGDVLWNNIEQNRQILDHDQAEHPWARFGGQVAGGFIAPGASIEGVGLAAARTALRDGATRFAAERLARRAVAQRLAAVGGAEGGLSGFGQGEDWQSRVEGAAIGAPLGAALGVATPFVVQGATRLARRVLGRDARAGVVDEVAADASKNAAEQDVTTSPAGASPPLPLGHQPLPAAPAGPSAIGVSQSAAMRAESGGATLYGPHLGEPSLPPGYRIVDRINVNDRPRPMLADVTEAQRGAQGQGIRPTDVLPLPDSAVSSLEEAAAINAGRYPALKAPDENKALVSRAIASPVDATRTLPKRGPLDLVTWLRTQGGLKPEWARDGGRNELDHMGITNAPRSGMDFAGGENRFGKLVDPENGMNYDEAAMRAHEAGFFPDHVERPTVQEFLDALQATHTGRNRSFRPDDYPEVDQFNADRSARHAIENARDEGAPMVHDRGEPVDMADLDRNAPPVHAYEEWGDQAPNYAGNLKLDKLDSPQAIKRALTVTQQRVGGFDAATRGRVTQAETANLAGELGMTPQQLLSRRKGQAFNAEEALAARQILAKSANELVNMAKRISGLENPGDEAMTAFREAWTRHVAIQEQVAGATAEAGRALSQFRMEASSRAVRGEVLKSLAEGPFGPTRLKEVADRIVDLDKLGTDPGTVNKFAADATKPKFRDKLVELYYNSILSGPTTHVVNVVSNTLTALGQLPEHAVAAAIGAPRAGLSSGTDRVLFSELGARSFGLLQGTKDGLAQAAKTFRTGRSGDLASKVEAQETHAISGIKGSIIRTPTRALSAEDELFKAMARRMELGGLAVRQAGAEGLKGPAAKARVAELIANPPDEMLAKSFDYGRYLTFQRPLPQGSFSQGISAATQRLPLAKLILPFIRTPVNILKFAGERSPAAVLLKEWRADFMAGGARRDLAIAKTAVGTGAMALAMEMASKGQITGGGPADRDIAATMRADGWQPYSVKIGGKYYSYSRLDPYSTTIGIAADFADLQSHMTKNEQDQVAGLLLASTVKNLADKTWFSGVVDMSQAISDPQRYGASYVRNRIASVAVPSVVAQVSRSLDPGQKDAKSILDAVRARIPGASFSVPNRQNPWGGDQVNEGGLGPDFLSPVRMSTAKADPVNAAVISAGAHIGQPSKKFGERMLSPEEYRALVSASGKIAHDRIAGVVTQPSWQAVPMEDRADTLHKIITDTRKEVRAGMFGAPPMKARRRPASDLPPGFTVVPPNALPPGYAVVR